MRAFLITFIMLTLNSASGSELFSVRCESRTPPTSYFATFDVDAKSVVFESPPAIAATYEGANVFAGEISSSGGTIEFTLRAVGGKISLTFDAGGKTMTWPGLNSATSHACAIIAPRSILSFRTAAQIQNPVSIRCSEAGYMYFTVDTQSKRALFDRGAEGRMYEGEVTVVRGDDIELLMKFDRPSKLLWNKREHTITFESDSDKPSRIIRCEETAPRTMIEYHKRLK